MYILGSHNSWSYANPKRWWLRPFKFMAKCQSEDIKGQYFNYAVRCFDLRIRFDKNDKPVVAHGGMVYNISEDNLMSDLEFLNNRVNPPYIRILHEVRRKKDYTKKEIKLFREFCDMLVHKFPKLKFWCGRNLYNWEVDFAFDENPTCEEKYSSVCPPKILDDWFPYLFAKMNNHKIKAQGTDKDILLIDFVNIGTLI